MAFKTTNTRYGKITFEDEAAYNRFMEEERKRMAEMYKPAATAQKPSLYEDVKTHYKGVATGERDPLYDIQAKQMSTELGTRTSAGANVLMQQIGEARGKSGLYGSRLSQFQTEAAHEGARQAGALQQQKIQRAESAWDKLTDIERQDYGRWRTSYVDALNANDWSTANRLWQQGTQQGWVKGAAPQYKEIMGPTQKELYETETRQKDITDLESRLGTALTRGDSATAGAIHQQLKNMGVSGFTGEIPNYQVMLDRNYAMQNPQMYLDSGNPSLIAKWYNLTGTKVVDKQTGQLREATATDFEEDEPDEVLLDNYRNIYSRFLRSNGYTVDEASGNITDPSGNVIGSINQLANTHLAYDSGLAARPPQLPGETDEAYAKRMEVFGISAEDIEQTPAPTATPAATTTAAPAAPATTPAPATDKYGFTEEEKTGMQAYTDMRVKNNVAYVKKTDGSLVALSEYEKSPDFANDPRFKDKKANDYVTLGDTTWVKQKSGTWKEGEPLSFDPTYDDAWGKEANDVLNAGRDTVPDLYDAVMQARVDEIFTNADFSKILRKSSSDPTYAAALNRAKTFEDKSSEEWRGSARNTYYNFATQVQNGDVINYNGKLYVVTSGLSRQYENVAWTTRDREYQKFEALDVTTNKRVTFYAKTGGKIEVA